MLLEAVVASVVLAATMTACLQLLGTAAGQRRAIRQQQAALREAGNVLERLSVRPWDELTPANAQQVQLSPEARAALPEGKLTVEITTPPDEQNARRSAGAVEWQDRSGAWPPPVRLVTWRYR